MKPRKYPEAPRKLPIQARSSLTVEAIFQASIQVLVDVGLDKFTTTRVAEAAGASVGTLYQYFPNKESLLAAVLERHLLRVVQAVEAASLAAKGKPLAEISNTLVNAYMDAKLHDTPASSVLYSVGTTLDAGELLARMTQRGQIALCDVLATASDARFDDLRAVSFMLVTAWSGPVQALLSAPRPVTSRQPLRGGQGNSGGASRFLESQGDPDTLAQSIRKQLVTMTLSYLERCAVSVR